MSTMLFGKNIFHFRDPTKLDVPCEPFMGFGSSRYETAVEAEKVEHEVGVIRAGQFSMTKTSVVGCSLIAGILKKKGSR